MKNWREKHQLNGQKGQSMVELALVLPILLLLFMGIVQFGFIFNGHITVTSAAREGARLAAVGHGDTAVRDRVKEAASAPLLTVERHNIHVTRNLGNAETLSVAVRGSVDIIVPILNVFTGRSVDVSSKSVMRVEVRPQ